MCKYNFFNMRVDWSEIIGLMEVSVMLYNCTYCIFTLWSSKVKTRTYMEQYQSPTLSQNGMQTTLHLCKFQANSHLLPQNGSDVLVFMCIRPEEKKVCSFWKAFLWHISTTMMYIGVLEKWGAIDTTWLHIWLREHKLNIFSDGK